MPWLSKTKLILIILILIGMLLHFYNLNWGAPFYFHPDERNIVSSVTQIHYPNQMNPHFFAYGSLPIYVIYFTGVVINYFSSLIPHLSPPTDPFTIAIIISRFYSALFATLLIPILFVIARSIATKQSHTSQNANITGLIAAILATTSVGFIQFAHFGTFEMWLTFFSVLLFWTCLQKLTKKNFLLMGIIFGILVSIKISSLALLPLLLFVIPAKAGIQRFRNKFGMTAIQTVINFLFICIIASLVYFLTNPFVFLDTQSFINSMQYESSLAIGTLPVFYTAEFFNTIPVVFQFIKIYPFLLNPLITILFIPSFIYLSWIAIKTKNKSYIILTTFYLILFLSQAFLFAKWTRYMVPTLPFIFLIIAIAFSDVIARSKTTKQSHNQQSFLRLPRSLWSLAMTSIVTLCSLLFASSYFITAFVRPDTRVAAETFAQQTIPPNAPILSEVYDMGIVPFNQSYTNIQLFNFYDLDNNSPDATPEKLQELLATSDYIILPSQRIIKPRLSEKNRFPQGNKFYQDLIDGKLGFQKIYQTPCDLFCKITYLGDPVFRFEQTANVFDRPTVMIFKKYQEYQRYQEPPENKSF